MYDTKIKAAREINVPAAEVWNLLTNPYKIPLFMPSLIENTNIPKLPLKPGSKFNYKYQMFGIILEGELTVSKFEPTKNYKFVTNGDAESEWNYTLKEKNGKTLVQLAVSYKPPKNVLDKVKGSILTKMNQKEAELFLENMKILLETQNE